MSRYRPMVPPVQLVVQGAIPKAKKKHHRRTCAYKRADLHCPDCDAVVCICPAECHPQANRHLSRCECSCRPAPPPFMC